MDKLTIIGAGNIGRAIARGLMEAGLMEAGGLTLTRRHPEKLADLAAEGCVVTDDNVAAVGANDILIVAVEPQQLDGVLDGIASSLDPARHVLVSVVSGATLDQIRSRLDKPVPVIRVMPNTAIAVRESMTCLCADESAAAVLPAVRTLFDQLGTTLIIDEEQMSAATALCACGTAFFLRAIRAASQGGIEIGFHSDDALTMAAQTARGAACLLLARGHHPEGEIDRVTTPRGATISGLNEMEHQGFSSAFIKGITTSARKVEGLYPKPE
jgi:pyrroline-5-carboxylate reductase